MGINRPEGEEVTTSDTSPVGVSDSYEATLIKGPDPEVWGADEDRPQPESASTLEGLATGEVRELEDGTLHKGPGPQWEQNEEGEYINR